MAKRIGGIISVKADGALLLAKGNYTYNLGQPKREMVAGTDQVHGFSESVQVPFIEGMITDTDDLDVEDILNITDATITLDTGSNKTIVLRNAAYTGDGNIDTEFGEIEVRFEGLRAEEVS